MTIEIKDNNRVDQARKQKGELTQELISIRDQIRTTLQQLESLRDLEQQRGSELQAIDRRIIELDYKQPTIRED